MNTMCQCSGAEVRGICTEAGMYALRKRRQRVTQDVEFAVAKICDCKLRVKRRTGGMAASAGTCIMRLPAFRTWPLTHRLTARTLDSPALQPSSFTRPRDIILLCVHPGGVLVLVDTPSSVLTSAQLRAFPQPACFTSEILRNNLNAIFGTGVFNSDGEMWKFHRSMTRPFFTRKRISHFEIFDRHADHAISKMKERF
ncbi:hypothetical protein A0H81_02009 [Grifola frondosa]|uniref:AAA ATPase AAA+ lid domain-containing protein n=1 Tax=Grifola frondosa TaxID=5627 RepID=A0A1C7MNG4_GRIFR|nr:hypothetical protein A0H81_02009 [Grifola frondosa]